MWNEGLMILMSLLELMAITGPLLEGTLEVEETSARMSANGRDDFDGD